jgi:hypothetical protein
MERITDRHLQAAVDRLNRITKSPMTTWTEHLGLPYTANAGNYHIDNAYGGVQLCRVCEGGGTNNVLGCGFITKRNLYELIHAYIKGWELIK